MKRQVLFFGIIISVFLFVACDKSASGIHDNELTLNLSNRILVRDSI